jgi:hypothetical protein
MEDAKNVGVRCHQGDKRTTGEKPNLGIPVVRGQHPGECKRNETAVPARPSP